MVNFKNIAIAATALLGYAQAAPAPRDVATKSSSIIKDGYIIKLKPDAKDFDSHVSWVDGVHKRNLAKRSDANRTYKGIDRKFTGKNHFNGYSGEFDELTIEEIRKSVDVEYVEEDQEWQIDHIQGDVSLLEKRALTTQKEATWGLGAISHRKPGSKSYIHDDAAGEGVWAYVVDTGLRDTHDEFEGRAKASWTGFKGDHEDTDGHGTHVAGTIAGKTYGVSKKANVVGVKVFQGDRTSTSIMIDGIGWAIDDILDKNRVGKAVINLSLGGDRSATLNDVVNEGSSKGIVFTVAAGNDAQKASKVSPASAKSAITVGAVNSNFQIWVDQKTGQGSNFGPELDIFGPGVDIISAGTSSDSATNVMTGTSMACPHIAGLVLYAMSVNQASSVEDVTKLLRDNGTPKVVKGNLRGSVNLLGNNGNKQQ